MKDPRDSTIKVLDLIKTFNNIGYEINIQKSVFLYANYELAEKGIRKIIPFMIASKKKK
jgi:hypothetical protein